MVQGLNPSWGKRFFAPVQTSPGAHPGGKAVGAWRLTPTPVKERV